MLKELACSKENTEEFLLLWGRNNIQTSTDVKTTTYGHLSGILKKKKNLRHAASTMRNKQSYF